MTNKRISIANLINNEPPQSPNELRNLKGAVLFNRRITPELICTLPPAVTEAIFESEVAADVLSALPPTVTSVKFNTPMNHLATLHALPKTVIKVDFSELATPASLTFLLQRAAERNGLTTTAVPFGNSTQASGSLAIHHRSTPNFFPPSVTPDANSASKKRGRDDVDLSNGATGLSYKRP